MRLFQKVKDGGPESPVDAYVLVEIKGLFNLFKKKENPREEFSEEDILLHKILLCVKGIIEKGSLVEDNSDSRTLPSVKFKDSKENTLYICWYNVDNRTVRDVYMNENPIPKSLDTQILRMAKARIDELQLENLKSMIEGVRR